MKYAFLIRNFKSAQSVPQALITQLSWQHTLLSYALETQAVIQSPGRPKFHLHNCIVGGIIP